MTLSEAFCEGYIVPWHDQARIDSLQGPSIEGDSLPTEIQESWSAALDPHSTSRLRKRLNWDNLSVEKISKWLNNDTNANNRASLNILSRESQPYLEQLESTLKQGWDLPLLPVQQDHGVPFIDLWIPIEQWAFQLVIKEQCFHNNNILVSSVAVQDLVKGLVKRLCEVSQQVLWEEFHKQQTAGSLLFANITGTLLGGGEVSRDKYQSFIFYHRRDGLSSLFRSYPVLPRFVNTVMQQWHESTVEMFKRLIEDIDPITDHFELNIPLSLGHIHYGLSDHHQGGRTVCVLCFDANDEPEQNDEVKIVYKPKNMDMEIAYQRFIDKLNMETPLSALRTVKVLPRGSYGYMEYVEHIQSCNSEELHEFYYNAGRLTAILHILGCTDCHYENLVASKNQLVLIDTETLFEPSTSIHGTQTAPSRSSEPSELRKRFQVSVLRTGLLPRWQIVGPRRLAVDISALGISPPQSSTYKRKGWLAINTDGMLPGMADYESEIPTSLPVSTGARNPLSLHLDIFCSGFSDQLKAIRQLQASREGKPNLLSNFSGLLRRIIVRGTHVYTTLREQQLKPSSLRTSYAQSVVLERLAAAYLVEDTKPGCWPLLADEIRQMNQLDIPFFVHSINGSQAETPYEEAISSSIDANGLATSIARLNSLDSSEIDFQVSLIRGAILARSSHATDTSLLNASDASECRSPLTQASANLQYPANYGLRCAQRIADHLLSLAISDSAGNTDWLGMDLSGDSLNVTFGPVGTNLYGGSIGVACLLFLLSQISDGPCSTHDYTSVVQAIISPIRRLAIDSSPDRKLRWWRNQPLGLGGSGGTMLALQALGETKLVCELFDGFRPEVLDADQGHDVISGTAGLVGCLLDQQSDFLNDLACMAGDLLCSRQRPCGSWSTSASRNRGLAGMSHGTSGILAALARLYRVTSHSHYRVAILKALSYERQIYDSDRKNWPDLRSQSDSFMTTWCHGAPGIALSRACLWGTDLWDETTESEINTALATTATVRLGYDHLCCGRLGLLGILQLLHCGPWNLQQDVSSLCQKAISGLKASAFNAFEEESIRLCCFSTQEGLITVPGFFNGLSGMGIVLINTAASAAMLSRFLSAGLWPLDL
jgi:type 2 lantibiotic biosynthesis protein LanM